MTLHLLLARKKSKTVLRHKQLSNAPAANAAAGAYPTPTSIGFVLFLLWLKLLYLLKKVREILTILLTIRLP